MPIFDIRLAEDNPFHFIAVSVSAKKQGYFCRWGTGFQVIDTAAIVA
jgi:hypothetical protein